METINLTLFLGRTLALTSVIHAVYGESRTMFFTRSDGVRFPIVSSTHVVRSEVDCSRKCQEDTDCWAVNFRSANLSCQLVTDVDRVESVAAPGWTSLQEDLCSQGWTHFEDNCYIAQDDIGTWDDAMDDCEILHPGAILADVISSAEQEFIESVIWNGFAAETHFAWLGGRDMEGTFVWYASGEPIENSYSNFRTNQPDSTDSCVGIWKADDFRWHDNECSNLYRSICKYRLTVGAH